MGNRHTNTPLCPVTLDHTMDLLTSNPGFQHVGENILLHLNYKSLMDCRSVSQSFKRIIDNPRFWLKKTAQKGMSRELQTAWDTCLRNLKDPYIKNEVMWLLTKMYQKPPSKFTFPIYLAAENGNAEVVKVLVAFTNNPNAPGILGYTPIFAASYRGHAEVVRVLAAFTNNPNAPEINGFTPIYVAAVSYKHLTLPTTPYV